MYLRVSNFISLLRQKGIAYRIRLITACINTFYWGHKQTHSLIHSRIHLQRIAIQIDSTNMTLEFWCKIFNKMFDFKFLLRQSFGFCLRLFTNNLDRSEWLIHNTQWSTRTRTQQMLATKQVSWRYSIVRGCDCDCTKVFPYTK